MRGRNQGGQGLGRGRGFGQSPKSGRGRGNPSPFCRFNPTLPSRRSRGVSAINNGSDYSLDETNYLTHTAELLKKQLETVNNKLNSIKNKR